MAVLTASQAPGAVAPASRAEPPAAPGASVSGGSPYRTELPPLRVADAAEEGRRAAAGRTPGAGVAAGRGGRLPATVFAAYRQAEERLADSAPGCGLRWQLLAAIGQVESGHAGGGRLGADGTTVSPILGPRLDGNGFALIRDTDGGAYDGDTVYDRAVGPMQFIPSTWAVWGADANGDGVAHPGNIHDAALAAGRYLCAGGRDLSDPYDLDRAILGYNHSSAYLRTVRAWYAHFLAGHQVVPDTVAARPGAAPPKAPARPGGSGTGAGGGGARPSSAPPREPAPAPAPAPASPSPAPSAPSPSASPSGPGTPTEPVLPVPDVVDVLPGGPVGNGKDSMTAAPSTTPDTRR
ncbi:lytic transglycosylase domain-containing protein [Streptomyces sp. NPDC047821]|uniref:lytic transglycosylase domain-containing protein n=1 Tax=Streptomyces sp. NPDC047821 TaxID=3365488 RepID=UPI003718C250